MTEQKQADEAKGSSTSEHATANESKQLNPLQTGLLSPNSETVIISAVLETIGQVRFGDGTDINLTITEKDFIPKSNANGFVKKVIFSGSKRRGVDRRTIHSLRNQHITMDPLCYIPQLCMECPTCWLYGGTGATAGEQALHGKKEYNIKSRVLYASACSVEPSEKAVAIHNRNAPDELEHTTGEAGIHSEELIKGGVHFPTLTVLDRVVRWEIGAFAHALLENVNGNRYTAASARQGGIKFSELPNPGKMIVVDVSPKNVFPLETVKVPAEEVDFSNVVELFNKATDLQKIKEAFERQGFTCSNETNKFTVSNSNNQALWSVEKKSDTNVITVGRASNMQSDDQSATSQPTQENDLIMTRYFGDRAFGYLRECQDQFKQFLEDYQDAAWKVTLGTIRTKFRLNKDQQTAQGGQAVGGQRRARGRKKDVQPEMSVPEATAESSVVGEEAGNETSEG